MVIHISILHVSPSFSLSLSLSVKKIEAFASSPFQLSLFTPNITPHILYNTHKNTSAALSRYSISKGLGMINEAHEGAIRI